MMVYLFLACKASIESLELYGCLIQSYNLITFCCIDGDIKVMIKFKTRPYLIKKQIDAKYKILLKRIFSTFYSFLYSFIKCKLQNPEIIV